MKKLVSVLFSALVAGNIYGQFGLGSKSSSGVQIPSGTYNVKPSGSGSSTEIDRIEVTWLDQGATLIAHYMSTNVQEIFFQIGNSKYYCANAQTTSSRTDSFDITGARNFTDIKPWQSFALEMKERFLRISTNVFVETVPFDLMGESIISGKSENIKVIVFKGGKHLRVINIDSWISSAPEKGSLRFGFDRMVNGAKNYIGFTSDGRYYFTVTKQKENFFLDVNTTQRLNSESK